MAARKYITEDDRYRIPLEDDVVVAKERKDAKYAAVILRTKPPEPKPLNLQTLSDFLHHAAGRGTPIEPRFLSNTEIHVISLPVLNISGRGFVAHYTRFDHSLELRTEFDVPEDFFLRQSSFIVGLSTSFNPLPDSTSSANQLTDSISVPDVRATPTESRGKAVATSVDDEASTTSSDSSTSCASDQLPDSINFLDTPATHTESRGKEVAPVEDEAPASGLDPRLLERNLEVGQAVASVAFAAAAMGWDARLLGPSLGFVTLGQLMGLTKGTDLANESPVAAILIFPSPARPLHDDITMSTIKSSIMKTFTQSLQWNGRPYGVVDAPEHYDDVCRWGNIMVAEKAGDDRVYLGTLRYCTTGPGFRYKRRATLRKALKSRESVSVADFDGDYTMPRGNFRQFLLRCCYGEPDVEYRPSWRPCFPCGVLPWFPRVNVFVFVNRVDGHETGLYCLRRNRENLKRHGSDDGGSTSLDTPYLWEARRLNNKDDPFYVCDELYLFRRAAPEPRHRESAFLVAMVAPCKHVMYSRQIWEAGFLGEVLAVEAQAQGLSVSALDSQGYDWKLALGINTGADMIISVYAVGKRKKKDGNKLQLFIKKALPGCFYGGAKQIP